MSHTTTQRPAIHAAQQQHIFPPLESITKPNLTTEEAAYYCDRAAQTLRFWACKQPVGVPRPIRVRGRLAWPVAQIRDLLAGGA